MQTESCYDLDMTDPYTKKGVQDYTSVMRCIIIKGVGYFFINKNVEITQDLALKIAEKLSEIGPMPSLSDETAVEA